MNPTSYNEWPGKTGPTGTLGVHGAGITNHLTVAFNTHSTRWRLYTAQPSGLYSLGENRYYYSAERIEL